MKENRSNITVLLADDHDVLREGLRRLLQTEGDIQVLAEAPNGREAVQLVKKLQPEVVVMDIAMPHMNGFEATRQILKAVPATRKRFQAPQPCLEPFPFPSRAWHLFQPCLTPFHTFSEKSAVL